MIAKSAVDASLGDPRFASKLGWWRQLPLGVGEDVLILLPSLGTTAVIFDDLVANFAERWPEASVVRADLPGHGRGPRTDAVSVVELAEQVVSFIDGLHARRISLVGVSMGGAIALEAARLRPDMVSHFAMINSAVRFGTEDGWRRLVEVVETSGMRGIAQEAAEGWFSDEFRNSRRAIAILAESSQVDEQSYIACCRALADYRGDLRLGEMVAPGVLIATADDQATPPAGMEHLSLALKTADYSKLPHGRHLSVVEHAREIANILIRVLR